MQTVFGIITVNYHLKDYPFPSVTICGLNRISENKISKLLRENPKYADNFSSRQLALLTNQILQVYKWEDDDLWQKELNEINNILETNGIELPEVINITMQVSYTYVDTYINTQ